MLPFLGGICSSHSGPLPESRGASWCLWRRNWIYAAHHFIFLVARLPPGKQIFALLLPSVTLTRTRPPPHPWSAVLQLLQIMGFGIRKHIVPAPLSHCLCDVILQLNEPQFLCVYNVDNNTCLVHFLRMKLRKRTCKILYMVGTCCFPFLHYCFFPPPFLSEAFSLRGW
jgi:hypothetical protein